MPATTNRQRLLSALFAHFKKHTAPPTAADGPVLDQLIYALLRENAGRAAADRAFENLRERFFDWNEVRVSSPHEVAAALEGLPQPLAKAQRVVGLLQELFESTYAFELDSLAKKGLKQAERQLARYQAASDFAVAWVIQRALDGHALPLDQPAMRVVKRLGLVDDTTDDVRTAQASLEHQVPKAKAPAFIDVIGALAHDRCGEQPRCGGCPLKPDCSFGSTYVAEPVRAGKVKPR